MGILRPAERVGILSEAQHEANIHKLPVVIAPARS